MKEEGGKREGGIGGQKREGKEGDMRVKERRVAKVRENGEKGGKEEERETARLIKVKLA